MKKKFIVLAMSAMAVILTGCGDSSDKTESKKPSKPEQKTEKSQTEKQPENQTVTDKIQQKTESRNTQNNSVKQTESTAKKNLTQLCGIVFGTVGKSDVPSKNSRLGDETMHFVKVQKKFMNFNDYYVLLTPKTKKIYGIIMCSTFKNADEAKKYFHLVKAVLAKHYNMKGEVNIYGKWHDFIFDNGQITVRYDSGFSNYSVEIRAYSSEYEELKKQEEKSVNTGDVQNVDTSGL